MTIPCGSRAWSVGSRLGTSQSALSHGASTTPLARTPTAQLKAIVGVELRITRVQAKAKLGQNRSSADIDGVIDGLQARGDQRLAEETGRARRH